jgi:hypothetical protein
MSPPVHKIWQTGEHYIIIYIESSCYEGVPNVVSFAKGNKIFTSEYPF